MSSHSLADTPSTSTGPPELREVATPEGLAAAIRRLGEEPRECLVCGTPAPRRLFMDSGKWHWECGACRLVFVHDIYPEFVTGIDGEEMCAMLHSAEPGRSERKLASWPTNF